jgi:hypothetical protein
MIQFYELGFGQMIYADAIHVRLRAFLLPDVEIF